MFLTRRTDCKQKFVLKNFWYSPRIRSIISSRAELSLVALCFLASDGDVRIIVSCCEIDEAIKRLFRGRFRHARGLGACPGRSLGILAMELTRRNAPYCRSRLANNVPSSEHGTLSGSIFPANSPAKTPTSNCDRPNKKTVSAYSRNVSTIVFLFVDVIHDRYARGPRFLPRPKHPPSGGQETETVNLSIILSMTSISCRSALTRERCK